MNPGPVLLRRFIRTSKSDPLVDQVDPIDSNQSFACIRYPDRRESTVLIQNLAPYPTGTETFSPQQTAHQSSIEIPPEPASVGLSDMQNESSVSPESGHYMEEHDPSDRDIGQAHRRAGRVSCPQKGMVGTKITWVFPSEKSSLFFLILFKIYRWFNVIRYNLSKIWW